MREEVHRSFDNLQDRNRDSRGAECVIFHFCATFVESGTFEILSRYRVWNVLWAVVLYNAHIVTIT